MLNSGKYKQYLSIPEAALVWSGLPLDLLSDAAYPSPGVLLIVGHPEVTARAEALIEATDWGTLMECSRMDPDIPLPSPDKRIVHRKDLMAWIAENWPDELPGVTPPVRHRSEPTTPSPPATDDKLLNETDVCERLSLSRSTLWRRIKAGQIPEATHKNPNRWALSALQPYIQGTTAVATENDEEI